MWNKQLLNGPDIDRSRHYLDLVAKVRGTGVRHVKFRELMWKHMPAGNPAICVRPDTYYVIMVRHPLGWLRSTLRHPFTFHSSSSTWRRRYTHTKKIARHVLEGQWTLTNPPGDKPDINMTFPSLLHAWEYQMQGYLQLRKLHPHRVRLVRYEEFIRYPSIVLQNIFRGASGGVFRREDETKEETDAEVERREENSSNPVPSFLQPYEGNARKFFNRRPEGYFESLQKLDIDIASHVFSWRAFKKHIIRQEEVEPVKLSKEVQERSLWERVVSFFLSSHSDSYSSSSTSKKIFKPSLLLCAELGYDCSKSRYPLLPL